MERLWDLRKNKWLRCGGISAALLLIGVLLANWIIVTQGGRFCVHSSGQVSRSTAAIVLGTDNPLAIERRANAAMTLLRSKVVPRIVVSGNPNNRGRNEVLMIADYLEKAGVAPSDIERDETGTNTRRTVQFARQAYGLKNIVFVTDDYHGARTAFLARHAGLTAICFVSPTNWQTWSLVKVHLREYFSCAKAVIETYLLDY